MRAYLVKQKQEWIAVLRKMWAVPLCVSCASFIFGWYYDPPIPIPVAFAVIMSIGACLDIVNHFIRDELAKFISRP